MTLYLSKTIFLTTFVCCIIFSLTSKSQSKTPNCLELKTGTFYSYPKNSNLRYNFTRTDDVQKEVNTNSGDSVLWKVNWISDCSYTLKYLSGSEKQKPEEADFLKKHKLLYEIGNITPNYYLFKTYVDNNKNPVIMSDTVWFKEKTLVTDNSLFKQIDISTAYRIRLKDTSKFALLYVYRPGKFPCSFIDYIVYYNDNIMYLAKNKSAYVFKILKEGPAMIRAVSQGKESTVKLDVQFGQRYYLASEIVWGSPCKPILLITDEEKGRKEFEKIQ